MTTVPRGSGRPGRYEVRIGVLERLGIRHMDGWLAFSAVGLIGLSIFTLMQTSTTAIPGAPNY